MSGPNHDAVLLGGRLITVTLLRVQDSSPPVIAAALDAHLRTAASLAALPTVLDLEALGPTLGGLDLPQLVELLRAREVSLIGVRDSGEAARTAALAAGLVVVKMDGARAVRPAPAAERQPEPAAPAAAEPLRTLTVTQPVRSGQQIYARGGDLVLTAPVSAGAEVMADGNIHAYGRLRGRAVAGVQGDTAARIYCQRLDAELVAIAGYYRLSDQISDAERAGPVQVRLEGESLLIEPL